MYPTENSLMAPHKTQKKNKTLTVVSKGLNNLPQSVHPKSSPTRSPCLLCSNWLTFFFYSLTMPNIHLRAFVLAAPSSCNLLLHTFTWPAHSHPLGILKRHLRKPFLIHLSRIALHHKSLPDLVLYMAL